MFFIIAKDSLDIEYIDVALIEYVTSTSADKS